MSEVLQAGKLHGENKLIFLAEVESSRSSFCTRKLKSQKFQQQIHKASRVTLADQTTYDAKVVGFDQDKDVAVLRVDAPNEKLRPIPPVVSADLLVGQKVYASGSQ